MRHKLLLSGILLSFIVICVACGKTDAEKSTLSSVADNKESEISLPKGLDIVEAAEDFIQVEADQTFQFNTDHQFYLSNDMDFAEGEDSYYYLQNKMYLYVFDKETQLFHILCNKPDCHHEYIPEEEITCNAILPAASGLVYYNHFLYTLLKEYSDDGKAEILCLYKISLDGAERNKVCELAKCFYSENVTEQINDETFSIWYIQHKGYLYYIYNFGTYGRSETFYNNGSNILYRIPIDGNEKPECITLLQKDGECALMYLKGIGSYVYYIQSDNSGMGDLYRLNTESMKIEKIPVTNIASEDYIVVGNTVIYKKKYDDNEFYQYHIDENTEDLYICADNETDYKVLYPEYDGKNIYIHKALPYNDYTLWKYDVIDENRQITAQFQNYRNQNEDIEFLSSLGGNTDFYFFLNLSGFLFYVDKNQLNGAELQLLEYKRSK